MTQSFRDFEHAGWTNGAVAANYHEHLSTVTTQSIGPLLDAARVTARSRVLDVATGAGYAAGAASKRGADTTGTDFSAEQLRMARARYPAVKFQECDAESLPFEAGTFDAVVCGFGVCHFPNPDVFFREALRVLKSGGRLAFTVWDSPQEAKVFGAIYGAIQMHGSMDIGLPVGPNFFLFSTPATSEKSLMEAGFRDCQVTRVPQMWRASSADQLFDAIMKGSVRAAATLKGQPTQALKAIRESVRTALNAFQRGMILEVPMPAVLTAATRP